MSIGNQGLASRNDHAMAPTMNARRAEALGAIVQAEMHGATLNQLSKAFEVAQNGIAGRISELKRMRLVRHAYGRRPMRAGSSAGVSVAVKSRSTREWQ